MIRSKTDAWIELRESFSRAPNDVRFLFGCALQDLDDKKRVSLNEIDNLRRAVERETRKRIATTTVTNVVARGTVRR